MQPCVKLCISVGKTSGSQIEELLGKPRIFGMLGTSLVVWFFVTPQTVACHVPVSTGFFQARILERAVMSCPSPGYGFASGIFFFFFFFYLCATGKAQNTWNGCPQSLQTGAAGARLHPSPTCRWRTTLGCDSEWEFLDFNQIAGNNVQARWTWGKSGSRETTQIQVPPPYLTHTTW